ncbi:MAG: glycosyltransferase, partial [Limnobacter sp.]|nr:glycosyltransferase [Limnobacter sp.]
MNEHASGPNDSVAAAAVPNAVPISRRPAPDGAAARPTAAGGAGSSAALRNWLVGSLLALVLATANLGGWHWLNPPVAPPDVDHRIAGLAYNGFQRWDDPFARKYPTAEQIDADLALLAGLTQRIRTYSSSEIPELPTLAERHGLRVTAGVWLDRRPANNRRELEAARLAVKTSSSIDRLMVGNEVLLRGDLTVQQLIAALVEMRTTARVPVSTAEPWHVWLRYPELARHVDFITVHLLPYWEGLPTDQALKYAEERLAAVKKRFPGRKVVIGEIGWPSQGDRFDGAHANPAAQASFIREFMASPMGRGSDYFLMEAIDQPWKVATEGRTGAYWGILHADRTPKFALQGEVHKDPRWFDKALLATLLALAPIAVFCARFARWRLPSRLFFGAMIQGAVSLLVWLVALPLDYYLRPADWLALVVLIPALLGMVAILLANGFEFAEMFWKGNLRRSFEPRPLPEGAREPFVSVHLACCNEAPEMVIATLDSLAALDYSNYEVVIVDNNTADEALWLPVQDHARKLGERFRFFHLPQWPGFKAGALNFALEQTDPRAEVVGVVDADYVVRRDWLRALVGHFADPKVAVVQAPQAHRDWARQPFRRMMNWEYEGFFRIGMHHRNERDAIIQHGTMTLIRADALREHGRWSEWCICEDAELGLRLMKAGLSTVYVDRVFGEGLTPDDFAAFGKQRRRWALGAMQILKAHWRTLLSGERLSAGQRFHFLTGWLSWFGDALHLVFAFAAMAWTIGIIAAPQWFSLPITLFMLPLFGFFAVKALAGPLLYLRRVDCGLRDALGAALAGMALSHSIARGVFAGLAQRRSVFEVTRKGTNKPAAAMGRWHPVREELLLAAGLLVCVAGMAISRKAGHPESLMWIAILAMQTVPYLATLVCNAIAGRPERAPQPTVEHEPPVELPTVVAAAPAWPARPAGPRPAGPR